MQFSTIGCYHPQNVQRRKSDRLVQRAQLILLAASGQSNTDIVSLLQLGRRSVLQWRNRWNQARQQWSGVREVETALAVVTLD